MPTQKKIDSVKSLTEKISRAKALILADYRGLKHKQFEEIRKVLKKLEADLLVAKNRLVLRALRSSGQALGDRAKDLEPSLHEPTAVLFSYGDEVAPLKELLRFFKAAGAGKTKIGLLGAHVLDESEVTRLATLPTRDALLAKLVNQLNAPIQGLHYALSWNINKLVWGLKGVISHYGKT